MKLTNIEKAKDVIQNYIEAKTACEALDNFEHDREILLDKSNTSTYGIEILVYPIDSKQPPVKLALQNRAFEIAAMRIIKDSYEYHKKQVECL